MMVDFATQQPPSPRRRRIRPEWKRKAQLSEEQSKLCLPPYLQSESSKLSVRPLSSIRSKKLFTMAAFLTTCLLFFLATKESSGSFLDVDEFNLRLRRRLRLRGVPVNRFSRTEKPMENGYNGTINQVDALRYLTLGGPSTYGRGLDDEKRTLQAYPYLLSRMVATNQDHVRNVAQPQYETGGLTFVSLCTESFVEGRSTKEEAKKLDSAFRPSSTTAYDVITLEYAPDASNDASMAAYKSSMKLLTRRLRKRYPFATIIVVQLWSPLDLVYYNPGDNRVISFAEWKRFEKEKMDHRYRQNDFSKEQEQLLLLEAMKKHDWTFRDLSPVEQLQSTDVETMLSIEKGTIYKMPKPTNINDSLNVITDWFLEEEIKNGDKKSSPLRYTLSRTGHAKVAEGIRGILESPSVAPTGRRPSGAYITEPTDSLLLGSWGSGDACRLWYETGKTDLPEAQEHSKGLKSTEFQPGQYALEVVSPDGGTLTVRNPFDEDRIVYLTYLTTSTRAAANKVYPKTKVSMVEPQKLAGSSTLVLDPSHDDSSDGLHRTRTTAVGLVGARSTGVLEFTPLEQYTVHNFRIVGVSFLTKEKTAHDVSLEFATSPRRILIDGSDDKISDFEDKNI